jgi:hypothetical protein
MPAFLETWPPDKVLILALIVAGATCLIVLILAILRYNMRALADATALQRERLNLKRELIQRGLPAQELEQAITLLKLNEDPAAAAAWARPKRFDGQPTDGQIDAGVAEHLALLDEVSPERLEQTISLVRATDRDGKEAALALLENLQEKREEGVEPQGEVVLAAVRSLCRPADKPREEGKSVEIAERITR